MALHQNISPNRSGLQVPGCRSKAAIWNRHRLLVNMIGSKDRRLIHWAGWILLLYAPAVFNAPAGKSPISNTHHRITQVNVIAGEMLGAHNAIRSRMNLPPFRWSDKLATYSQKWADTLLVKNRSEHNPDSPYGENIFITGSGATSTKVVHEWASESRDYNYRTNECSGDCGHYTQIVWRNSREVGCAAARGAQREISVCSYDPPGNYRNEWPF